MINYTANQMFYIGELEDYIKGGDRLSRIKKDEVIGAFEQSNQILVKTRTISIGLPAAALANLTQTTTVADPAAAPKFMGLSNTYFDIQGIAATIAAATSTTVGGVGNLLGAAFDTNAAECVIKNDTGAALFISFDATAATTADYAILASETESFPGDKDHLDKLRLYSAGGGRVLLKIRGLR